jgi:hypothetical protein
VNSVSFGGYGPAATIVGLFFIIGVITAPFLPETGGGRYPIRCEDAVLFMAPAGSAP